ncbi:hypothetical protein KL938_004902 [Ogataea parapolymorpha]|nr:hypothetical protein KL938_004902 [Ogataea parapolymorpha]
MDEMLKQGSSAPEAGHVAGDVVGLSELIAFSIRERVNGGEHNGQADKCQRKKLELEHCHDSQNQPENRTRIEEEPEHLGVDGVDVSVRVGCLKHPDGLAEIVGLVPPPEAHHQPARYVFNVPEVGGQQKHGDDEVEYVIGGEEDAQEVYQERSQSEK